MMLYAAIGGYALLFTTVGGLFRVGYDMPRFLSGGLAGVFVVIAGVLAVTGAATGLGSMTETSSYATAVVLAFVAMLGILNDQASHA